MYLSETGDVIMMVHVGLPGEAGTVREVIDEETGTTDTQGLLLPTTLVAVMNTGLITEGRAPLAMSTTPGIVGDSTLKGKDDWQLGTDKQAKNA